ncbi:energy transducer TonB [Luteimonas huabeiensis]|uniref:energy transducer TonB n=1 Tax=Luteimonas huabeiensis TaxID=1244513 RepID=UPI000465D5C0|nr:energy transducer TonB [Luteimonas huabeiensis]
MNAKPPRSRARRTRLPLPAALALALGAAFLAGVLLFAAAYLARRPAQPENGPALPARAGRAVSALPSPQPASERRADAPRQAPALDPVESAVAPAAQAMPAVADPGAAEDGGALPGTVPPAAGATRAPVAVRTPAPDYPRTAMRRGEAGEVIVAVRVDREGRPREVRVDRSSGYPALDRAAAGAVRRWRFEPALEGGRPVEAEVRVPVEFVGDGWR